MKRHHYVLILALVLQTSISSAKVCSDLFDNVFLQEDFYFVTSNPIKKKVIQKSLQQHSLNANFIKRDIKEIISDDISIASHKASSVYKKGEIRIIEDTSLFVQGEKIGPLIKWHMHRLEELVGKKAEFSIIFAYQHKNQVYIFKESINGIIRKPKKGLGNGLGAYFYIKELAKTLKELRQDKELAQIYDPRQVAIERILRNNYDTLAEPILSWHGKWQE